MIQPMKAPILTFRKTMISNPIIPPCLFRASRQFCQLGGAILLTGVGVVSAADLLRWDVTGTTGVTGSGIASVLAAGTSGSAMTVVTTAGNATGNSSSPSATWNRTFTVNADFATAQVAGNYFSFTTTAAAGYTVSISGMTGLNLSRTSSGPTSAGLFYSTDGTNFTQTGSTFTVLSSLTSAASAFDDTIAVTPIVINGGETGYWRLVVFGGTLTSRLGIGNAGTNDFTLTGSSTAAVAPRNLLWTGAGGSDWNTSPSNTNWSDTATSTATAFVTNDIATISTAAAITVDAGGITTGNVTVDNASGTVDLAGGNLTGLILTKSAAGTLSMGGNNSFSGGVSITGGTLQAASDTTLGNSTISINGATLKTTSSVTSLTNILSLGTSGSAISTDTPVTFSGQVNTNGAAINASNVLTKSGPGTLALTRTGSSAFGSQMTSNVSGGAIELDITAGGVIFSGTGQRNLGGTSTWDAPVTLSGGTLMLHGGVVNGSATITVTANSSINSRLNFSTTNLTNSILVDSGVVLSLDSANGSNALALGGIISGDGAVTKTGNGVVRIEGANTYTGTTTISAGTLRVGTGLVGTLGTGEVVISAGTLQLNRDDNVTIANLISGAGNVTGSSLDHTATLTAENTYTGITTITEGKIGAPLLANGGVSSSIGASASAAANLVFNGGSLSYAGAGDASTDRDFTLGINGGGPSATTAGSINFTSTNPITLAGAVPDTTASVSSTPSITLLITGNFYQIVTLGDTDFTLIGAPSNTVGVSFTATGAGTGTGTVVSGLTIGRTYRIVTPGTTNFVSLGAADNLVNTVFTATNSGFNSGTGTIAYANSNFRDLRLGGSGTGNNSLAAVIIDGPTDPNTFNQNKTSLTKNGTSTWTVSGTNTYTGPTKINEGILKLDGNNSSATGAVTVLANASLGGNGSSGGQVTLASSSGLAAKISNWTGSAGTGYDDLSVASLVVSGSVVVKIDTTGITNFTESVKSFTILDAPGGITGFNPSTVTFATTGFTGTGTWSLAQSGNSLVLSYALAVADPYLAWVTGAPYNLSGANALPSADPDKDGISNSVEFVIGGNPATVSNTALLPTLSVNSTQLVFTYRLSDASAYLNPTVEYGSDLVGWTVAQNGVNGIIIGTPTPLESGIKQVIVTIPNALASGAKLFARLKVNSL